METKNETNLLFSENIQEIEDKDHDNVELLIAENISLVKRLVYRLGFPASEFDDFVSVGYIGLIKAARTYDINKDYAFSTYAGKCINNEIIMYVRKHYKKWWNITYLDDTLHQNSEEDEQTLHDVLPDANAHREERTTDCLELAETIQRILNSLDIRSIVILFSNAAGWPQDFIAKQLKLSQPSVSRLVQKARDELTYSHNVNGEWQVSYNYSTLAIHQNNQVSIQLLVDDYLWDNLTSWLIKVFTLPRLQQCTQHNKFTRGKTGGNRLPDSVHNERAKEYAEYIIEHDATMRKTAEHFYVSKNTVHDEITKTLPHCYPDLFAEVQKVIARNKFERFSRGGKATKRKNNRLNDRVAYKRF